MKIKNPKNIEYYLDKIENLNIEETVISNLEEGNLVNSKKNSSYVIDDPNIYNNLPVYRYGDNDVVPEELMEDVKDHFKIDFLFDGRMDTDYKDKLIDSLFENFGRIEKSFADPFLFHEYLPFSQIYGSGLGACLESSILFQLGSQNKRKTYTIHSYTQGGFLHVFNMIRSKDGNLYMMDINNPSDADEKEELLEFNLDKGEFITNIESRYRPFLLNNYGQILNNMEKQEDIDELREVLSVKK
ncbi:MAG: hypothetical protein ABEK17_01650 [Candidatus Aenigmatarchaeota archaeon]